MITRSNPPLSKYIIFLLPIQRVRAVPAYFSPLKIPLCPIFQTTVSNLKHEEPLTARTHTAFEKPPLA